MEEASDILREIYYNPRTGFVGKKELIRRGKEKKVTKEVTSKWYKQQPVNQIIINWRKVIDYHKTIGDGDGY